MTQTSTAGAVLAAEVAESDAGRGDVDEAMIAGGELVVLVVGKATAPSAFPTTRTRAGPVKEKRAAGSGAPWIPLSGSTLSTSRLRWPPARRRRPRSSTGCPSWR